MSDDNPIVPDTSNDLVVRGSDGDPVPLGTRMIERESYERVVEGLKIMADSAAHLAALEPQSRLIWNAMRDRLDKCRRIAVQRAGLSEVMQQRQTEEPRHGVLPWMAARKRFMEGGKQAAGGMRQLATCHRMDFVWSKMAGEIEELIRKLQEGGRKKRAMRMPLILPPSYH